MRAILLDIEGTTTPIDFVHKTLFPYARSRVGSFLEANLCKVQTEIDQLERDSRDDSTYSERFDRSSPTSVANYLIHLIDQDRKSTPLKSIQGEIWREGYESGELRSIVFDDVPLAFERWTKAGKKIAIYSSGSVLAQQLLFRYTNHGDLTPYISSYFDTNVGGKRDPESYKKIAEQLDTAAPEICFLSDVVAELDAARAAAMETKLVTRPGNTEVAESGMHQVLSDFDTYE